MQTYVFDFYNVYIPKGMKYGNGKLGIKIIPLKFAEYFERNRSSFSKPYHRGSWRTAKCYIKAKSEADAIKLAGWLELLYSFAQSRSVFFLDWYIYGKGRKYSSSQFKFIERRENRFSELIKGVKTKGAFYTRDISYFVDVALETLLSKEDKQNEILTTIHAYNISHSEIVFELRFLICWIVLESLSNKHYTPIFSEVEIENIKNILRKAFKENLKGDKRLGIVKGRFKSNYLYEDRAFEKVRKYLLSIDHGLDQRGLNIVLECMIEIRNDLVHCLESCLLRKKPEMLFYLQKIMENVIFRLLGFDKEMQDRLLLNQYNRGIL